VFGKRQLFDAGIKAGDCLVAVSEGGETSSVIGTIHAALETRLKTHFLFNNPSDLLVQKIERSRKVIEDSRVNIVNLTTGAMAVAGSTRMQAVTIEMLITGLAFESALTEHLRKTLPQHIVQKIVPVPQTPLEGLKRFEHLLRQLRQQDNLKTLAGITDFEYSIYRTHGLITYFPDEYSIDIFTDTTERSPTFKIPPFRSTLEKTAPPSWAFVKDPARTTPEAWNNLLGRAPCCLTWQSDDYRNMNVAENIIAHPPEINIDILYTYKIGNEEDLSRFAVVPNAAVAFLIGQKEIKHLTETSQWFQAFHKAGEHFETRSAIAIGSKRPDFVMKNFVANEWNGNVFFIEVDLPESPLDLFSHLAAKLVLNNISTAAMGKLGRLNGNWMAHVDATNKKLIDRSIRLVAELTGFDYDTSCLAVFKTLHEMNSWSEEPRKTISPVAYTIEQIERGTIHV
jgi:N-acetylmuramic acid 6-phosphate etherase